MNLLEWSKYVLNIPKEELIEQASFLGSQAFINSMIEKNISLEDIEKIHKLVAQRFEKDGLIIPKNLNGCVVNYYNILYPIL